MATVAQRNLERVFRWHKRCLQCPSNGALSCDGLQCPSGQVCVQTSQSCDACASVACAVDPTGPPPSSNKTNAGAIAGGVLGGIAVIAIITFITWKFCLKGKRRPADPALWQEVDMAAEQEKEGSDFHSRRSARASTHTVASMASSVLTRASNIIQIAYIPGVTNRSGPGSPGLLVPPVPPIPAMSSASGRSSPYSVSEQHFFVPDFRDSVASSSTAGRASLAPSVAQRGSVASTMYRQNAIVSPLPAQTIVRGKAAVVSVKSQGSGSSDSPAVETPPVPSIDAKHNVKPVRIAMPGISPANSIRSTAQLGPVRALHITKKKSSELTPPQSAAGSATDSAASTDKTLIDPCDVPLSSARPMTDYSLVSSDDETAHSRARRGSLASTSDSDSEDEHGRGQHTLPPPSASEHDAKLTTDSQDASTANASSPFADNPAPDAPRPTMSQRITSYDAARDLRVPMTPIVEETPGSQRNSTASHIREHSPFSDSNRSDL